jgi:hypothetical protein
MTALMVWASDRLIDRQQTKPSVRVFGDTFQEEFLVFLKKNHIEYDERYIWD